ncbi:Actin-like protein ARP9 [Meyerozyma sp. JA9]|nr:Actin-like protein ARP9 [Meyerozyma sp. JA9]
MPLFREENFLIVHVGSLHTIFSFGLQDSLSPPQYKVPSVVFQAENGEYHSKNEEGKYKEINPIQGSRIVDLEAFQYLLNIILQSVISQNPIITINQIPLLLITPSLSWSRYQVEHITKYVLETLEFNAFNVIDIALASNFAMGSSTSSCVVNVGRDSVQIMPVVGNQCVKYAGKYIADVGGKSVNEELAALLPKLNANQIEALKTSGIFEVLNDEEDSFYSFADLNRVSEGNEDDDNFDIAKLVTESSSEPAAVANGEQQDGEAAEAPSKQKNKELESNFFLDPDTKEKIYVGKERFQGCKNFINTIAHAIYTSLLSIPDLEKRQQCYDNLIFVGSTFKIPGLKHALLMKLTADYLVRPANDVSNKEKSKNVNSAILAYQQAEEVNDSNEGFNVVQVPGSIKLAKHPEYFPEWKLPKESGGSWEDVYFLGAEIYAKQIFGGNSNHGGEIFVDSEMYKYKGPQAIWDSAL